MILHSILLVEDDKFISKLLDSFYTKLHCTHKSASSEEEALKILENEDFTIFILDIDLGPGMHGVDLAVILRKKFPDAKIFAFTGYTNLFDTISPSVAGFDAVFDKIEGFNDIIHIIKEIIEKDS